MSERDIIDPTRPFFMAQMVTQAGQPDRIDFGAEEPVVGVDEDVLIKWCREEARQFGGRYYVFAVKPVRRITKATHKLIG